MQQSEVRYQALSSGPLSLDPHKRQVWLDGRAVDLSALPLRILEALLSAEGRVVTRSELKQQLWPYAQRIDTERRLNTAMRALRAALGDTAAQPRLIETLRGQGYRWVAAETSNPTSVAWLHIAATAALALLAASPGAFVVRAPTAAHEQPPSIAAAWRNAEAYQAEHRFDPSDLAARRELAWTYVNQGRPSAALPEIATLLQAGDHSAQRQAELGWLLLRSGTPAAALATCSGQAQISLNLLSCRQTALARLGLVNQARSVAVQIMQTANAPPQVVRRVANAPAAVGYLRFLRWRVGAFVRPGRDWFQRAQLQAEAGMYSDALESLRRAAVASDPLLVKIKSTAEFAPLRHSPDYLRIAAAVLAGESAGQLISVSRSPSGSS